MKRREFMKNTIILSSAIATTGVLNSCSSFRGGSSNKDNVKLISKLDKPLAIASWDYSWILRHHRYGEYENWEQCLMELSERGYNAIQIDVMPQFVVRNKLKKLEKTFWSSKSQWSPPLFGNDYSMSFSPRSSLAEFIPLCKKWGMKIGLCTYFLNHNTDRKAIFEDPDGLYKAWDDTLGYLYSNDLMEDVVYVNILNCPVDQTDLVWLKNKLHSIEREKGKQQKIIFYKEYLRKLVSDLQRKYPHLDYLISMDSSVDINSLEFNIFDGIDYHISVADYQSFRSLDELNKLDPKSNFFDLNSSLIQDWNESKKDAIRWMYQKVDTLSRASHNKNCIIGNSNGWETKLWFDHPELDWNWIREVSEIGVQIALQCSNCKFVSVSHFSQPQFKGFWRDARWHRRITQKIKDGRVINSETLMENDIDSRKRKHRKHKKDK